MDALTPCTICGKLLKPGGTRSHSVIWCKKQQEKNARNLEYVTARGGNASASATSSISAAALSAIVPPKSLLTPNDVSTAHSQVSQSLQDADIFELNTNGQEPSAYFPPSISAPGIPAITPGIGAGDTIFFQDPDLHYDPVQANEGDVKLVYHPHSQHPTQIVSAAQYQSMNQRDDEVSIPLPSDPWAPFPSMLDFQVAKWMLDAGMNKPLIVRGIDLFKRCQAQASPQDKFTIESHSHLRSMWKEAAVLRTKFEHREVKVDFNDSERRTVSLHRRPLWDWTLDLLRSPQLAPLFHWDAMRKYRVINGRWERFIDKPWSADSCWEMQSSLDPHGKPLMYIIYADKARLSSFGTAKGYPVIARIANLDSDIAGWTARVIGWIVVIEEESSDNGKKVFVDYKNRVWHNSVTDVIESAVKFATEGKAFPLKDSNGFEVVLDLFTRLLVLSSDYEEQAVMNLIRGLNGLFPCPRCLVPKDKLSDLSLRFPLRTAEHTAKVLEAAEGQKRQTEKEKVLKSFSVRPITNAFAAMSGSDYHGASSYDPLHTDHSGFWNAHLKEQLLALIAALPGRVGATVDARAAIFPRWRTLNHIEKITTMHFADGSKHRDISKIFLFACHGLFSEDSLGHLLLRCLRSYLNFTMYNELTVHTESTIAATRHEVQVLDSLMKEYISRTQGTPHEKNWNFIKFHLRVHAVDDILAKGPSRGLSTKLYEKMHGPLKKIYQRQTNFKNTDVQLLRIEHSLLVSSVIQEQINLFNKWNTPCTQSDRVSVSPSIETASSASRYNQILTQDLGSKEQCLSEWTRFKLGAFGDSVTFSQLEDTSPTFNQFRMQLTAFLLHALPSRGYQNPREQAMFKASDQVFPYRLLHISYESAADYSTEIDYLRANPSFHKRPRYDFVLVKSDSLSPPFFAKIVYMFSCIPSHATRKFNLLLVKPFEIAPRVEGDKRDEHLGYLRLRPCTDTNTSFIFLESIIRGALLIPTTEAEDEHLVFDLLDDDAFVRCRKVFPGRTEGQPFPDSDLTVRECDGPDLDEIVRALELPPNRRGRGRQKEKEKNLSIPLDLFVSDSESELDNQNDGRALAVGLDEDSGEEFDLDNISDSSDDDFDYCIR